MAQFVAGEIYTVTLGEATLTIKVEDASKSEAISARVEAITGKATDYAVEGIYDFDRKLFVGT